MLQDNLVSKANKAKAKAPFYRNIHLDWWCPMGKRLLKMNINFYDQLKKIQKFDAVLQIYFKANNAQEETKASEKTKKDKKQKLF